MVMKFEPNSRTLDKLVAEINQAGQDEASAAWRRGKALAKIWSEQTWKLRRDENGRLPYRSFEDFAKREIVPQATMTTIYKYIAIAEKWSAGVVARAGITKSYQVLRAHPADREEIMQRVFAGASKRQIEEEVRNSQILRGYIPESRHARAGRRSVKVRRGRKARKFSALRRSVEMAVDAIRNEKCEGALKILEKALLLPSE